MLKKLFSILPASFLLLSIIFNSFTITPVLALSSTGVSTNTNFGTELSLKPDGLLTAGGVFNWNMSLQGFNRQGQNTIPVKSAAAALSNGMMKLDRGNLIEWYQPAGAGMEQGFTINQAPAGSGLLNLQLKVRTSLFPILDEDARGISFTDGKDQLLRYDSLKAADANLTELPASLSYEDGSLVIAVDDSFAVYPVTIDPLIYKGVKKMGKDTKGPDWFGTSVAIDGSTAVIGSPYHNSGKGAAYVFTLNRGAWSQTAKLTASNAAANDLFGESVSISGNTIAVGAPQHDVNLNVNQGMAYIFVKPAAGNWKNATQTAILSTENSDGTANANFGQSISISGSLAAVGEPGANSSQGKVEIFKKPDAGWTGTINPSTQKEASSGAASDFYGWSVSLSGTFLAVGAPTADFSGWINCGVVYVYQYNPETDVWGAEHNLVVYDPSSSGYELGDSVAVTSDGVVAAGAPFTDIGYNNEQGAVYIFEFDPAAGWSDPTKIIGETGQASDHFGFAVSLSGDTLVIGIPGRNSAAGLAYVYIKPSAGWKYLDQAYTPLFYPLSPGLLGSAEDTTGNSVAASGSTVLVGSPADKVKDFNPYGSVYFFSPARTFTDLAILAESSLMNVKKDDEFDLTINMRNNGPEQANNVLVNVPMPQGVSIVSSTHSSATTFSSLSGVWNLGNMTQGNTGTLVLHLKVTSNINTTLTFTPRIAAADIDAVNNFATVQVKQTAPLLKISPSSLAFGEVIETKTSPAKLVTVTNTGGYKAAIGSITAPYHYSVVSDTCSSTQLDPGKKCTFGVTYSPVSETTNTGNVTIPYDDLSAAIPVTGTGVILVLDIKNNSFETGPKAPPAKWVKGSNWQAGDGQNCTVFYQGKCSLKLAGNGKLKSFSQKINVSGTSGADFDFWAWNKSETLTTDSVSKLTFTIKLGSIVVDSQSIDFDLTQHDFQMKLISLTASGNFDNIEVKYEYQGDAAVYMDEFHCNWIP